MEAAVAINGACEVKTNLLGFDGVERNVDEQMEIDVTDSPIVASVPSQYTGGDKFWLIEFASDNTHSDTQASLNLRLWGDHHIYHNFFNMCSKSKALCDQHTT